VEIIMILAKNIPIEQLLAVHNHDSPLFRQLCLQFVGRDETPHATAKGRGENIMHDKQTAAPDSTAVRVALWRAMHAQIDQPPHVLEDEIGLRLVAPEEDRKNVV